MLQSRSSNFRKRNTCRHHRAAANAVALHAEKKQKYYRAVFTMKITDIHLRDPFVLHENGQYFLYGTRGETAFSKKADGFDVYLSKDMLEWDGPKVCFSKPQDFWATKNFWAPEVYAYRGAYYMFATFANDAKQLGTAVLRAQFPVGPFVPWSHGTITPPKWRCLDGTLHIENGQPYMIFSREWKQVHDGQIYAVALSEDFRQAKGTPFLLFRASQGRPLVKSFLFRNYVTDGPFPFKTEDGRLHLLWSSFGKNGYMQAVAHSDNNLLCGSWQIVQQPLFHNDGGHGMIFRDDAGRPFLTLHSPNRNSKEHPIFIPLKYEGNELKAEERD